MKEFRFPFPIDGEVDVKYVTSVFRGIEGFIDFSISNRDIQKDGSVVKVDRYIKIIVEEDSAEASIKTVVDKVINELPDIISVNQQISEQVKSNNIAREFLSITDWKVIRHRDQLDAGSDTSLTDAEYRTLLAERQAKRDSVIE